jgi:hypothetical protein
MRIVVMIMNDGLESKLSFLLFEVLSQYFLKDTQDNWSLSSDSNREFIIIWETADWIERVGSHIKDELRWLNSHDIAQLWACVQSSET